MRVYDCPCGERLPKGEAPVGRTRTPRKGYFDVDPRDNRWHLTLKLLSEFYSVEVLGEAFYTSSLVAMARKDDEASKVAHPATFPAINVMPPLRDRAERSQ